MRLTADNPDLLVLAHVARQEKSRLETWDEDYYNTPVWGMPSNYDYEVGPLSLAMVSPGSQKLLWRGSAKAEIDAVMNREARRQLIETAIEKILKQFPPGTAE